MADDTDKQDKVQADCCQLTPKWLSTGDMARLSGTTLRTVRFYETEGLITPSERDGTSHRRFSPAELRKLQCICGLREAGLSLQEIKTLIGIKQRCPSADSAAATLMLALNKRIAELQERMTVLARVREDLCATVETLQSCKGCAEPSFPEPCQGCSRMNQPELPAATELFWKN